MKESQKTRNNKIKVIIKEFCSWIGAIAIGVAVTSFFVLIYNYTGTHIKNDNGATDYKWEPNQYQATMVEGNAWIHLDDEGFNNLSKPENIDILLMGASHMEAAMIPQNKNTGYLLDEGLDGLHTYNIGMSGHELLTCLDNLEAAIETYHPKKYIIIQSGNLSFDDESLTRTIDGQLNEIPSFDSGIIFWLQKIPTIKVSFKQVSEKFEKDFSSTNFFIPKRIKNNAIFAKKEEGSFSWNRELLGTLLKEKSEYCHKCGIQLILAYTPSVSVDKYLNQLVRNDLSGLSEYMKSICDDSDIVFVDSFDDFQEAYENHQKFPFGFNNTKPFVGHLNEDGHGLLANRLVATIIQLEANQ